MTNFGERIYDLRTRNNMSQGALADKLDVSRQTVSKWENNMCLPEAEKLLQLSEIFGVSTDYILKGITIVEPEPVYIYVKDPESESVPKHNERIIRKYVGIVIAIIGALLSLGLALAGGWLFIIFTGALVLLGILFDKGAEHPWLIISWVSYVLLVCAFPFCTAINPLMIFNPVIYTDGYIVHLLWSWGIWLVLAILVICTAKAKRGYVFKPKENKQQKGDSV